jgi:hypothetical protein
MPWRKKAKDCALRSLSPGPNSLLVSRKQFDTIWQIEYLSNGMSLSYMGVSYTRAPGARPAIE